jgi:hypothetical protein
MSEGRVPKFFLNFTREIFGAMTTPMNYSPNLQTGQDPFRGGISHCVTSCRSSPPLDLSRFRAVLLMAFIAAKAMNHGTRKNGRFSDARIMAILRQAEGGVPVSELCLEHGMSSASFYK